MRLFKLLGVRAALAQKLLLISCAAELRCRHNNHVYAALAHKKLGARS